MAFLTGKANIIGGYIYGSEFCPILLGKNNCGILTTHTRISELYSKHLDNNGTLSISDSLNINRICLDNNNILKFTGETIMDILTVNNNITFNSTFDVNSSNINFNLNTDKQFIVHRDGVNTDYMCKFSSEKALNIDGICNIDGNLLINGISFIDSINTSIDNKLNNLNTLSLKPINNIAGIFIKTSSENEVPILGEGIIWKNNQFNVLKNLQFTNNTVINNGTSDEYGDLHVNNLTSHSVQTDNIYLPLHKFDLNTITSSLTNIDTTTHSITQFTNGNQTTKSFKLLNPTTINGIRHQFIADNTFNGIVEIEGDFIFPDGTINNSVVNKKIQLNKKGQNILLTFISNYWYITNGGVQII